MSAPARAKAYLSEQVSADAQAALVYLAKCEEAGDFADFSVEDYARWWGQYYGDGASEHPQE